MYPLSGRDCTSSSKNHLWVKQLRIVKSIQAVWHVSKRECTYFSTSFHSYNWISVSERDWKSDSTIAPSNTHSNLNIRYFCPVALWKSGITPVFIKSGRAARQKFCPLRVLCQAKIFCRNTSDTACLVHRVTQLHLTVRSESASLYLNQIRRCTYEYNSQ